MRQNFNNTQSFNNRTQAITVGLIINSNKNWRNIAALPTQTVFFLIRCFDREDNIRLDSIREKFQDKVNLKKTKN